MPQASIFEFSSWLLVFPDDGKLLKAVTIMTNRGAMEEVLLEELDIFQV